MKRIEKIAVVGLGAVGASYASMLYDMDPSCVRVVADKERADRLSQSGLIINGKRYDFNFVLPGDKSGPADLIIVAVKYHQLEQAVKDMKNQVGQDTIILSLLNGITSEEIIGSEYGMDKMLYSMCVGIDAVRESNIINFLKTAKIHFGEKKNIIHTPKVESVRDLFDRAGIGYIIPEDMMRTLWWKFMMNVGLNQASAVLRAPYIVFKEVKEAYDFMVSAMREVIDISKKTGINLDDSDIEEFDLFLNRAMPDGKTSMLQDVEAGRKTEVEMFAGAVCELGKKYGISTPVNEALFRIIRTFEQS